MNLLSDGVFKLTGWGWAMVSTTRCSIWLCFKGLGITGALGTSDVSLVNLLGKLGPGQRSSQTARQVAGEADTTFTPVF